MASATSSVSVVTRGTSVRNKKKSYYVTDATTLGDGSVKRETYRTDASGNNRVKIQEVTADKDGKLTSNQILSTASSDEKKDLNNPNSKLRNTISQQTKQAGEAATLNETEAAAGGLTSVGKKNLEVLGGGSGNNAETAPETGDNSQPATTPSGSGQSTAREQFGNHTYPLDLGSSKQDVIKFSMLKYQPKKFSGVGFSNRDSNRSNIGTVILPIQTGIKDTNAVQFGSENMNPLEAAAASVSIGAISEGAEGAMDAAGSVAAAVSGGREDIKTALTAAFAGAATGTGAQLLTRTTGAVINPNTELLFKGPSLRQFSFAFKLSARSQDEAEEIKKIIRFFKQGSAPITTPSNIFLKSPHTFKIQYLLRGESDDHPFIGQIKESALTSFSVDYTPEGNYATFSDGAMVSYQITMSFQELEPVFNNDYTELDGDQDTQIGF